MRLDLYQQETARIAHEQTRLLDGTGRFQPFKLKERTP